MRKSTIFIVVYYICFIVFYFPMALLYLYLDVNIAKYQLSQASKAFYNQYCNEHVNIKSVDFRTVLFSGVTWEVNTTSAFIPTLRGLYKDGVAYTNLDDLYVKDQVSVCNISLSNRSSFFLDRIRMSFVPSRYTHSYEIKGSYIVPVLLNVSGLLAGVLVFVIIRQKEMNTRSPF